jgi:hypothetical protein
VLERLAASDDAAEAFDRLKLNDRRAEMHVLAACIAADYGARNFRSLVAKQQVAERVKRWNKAVADLRKLVVELAEEKEPPRLGFVPGFWSLSILQPPADNEMLSQALDLIASSVEWRQAIAKANRAQLGVTRNAYMKQAAARAGVWVLAAGVDAATRKPLLTGKPHPKDAHLQEMADLANVVLETAVENQVTADHVRDVRRRLRELYLKTIRDQTRRHFREKAARARSASGALGALKTRSNTP